MAYQSAAEITPAQAERRRRACLAALRAAGMLASLTPELIDKLVGMVDPDCLDASVRQVVEAHPAYSGRRGRPTPWRPGCDADGRLTRPGVRGRRP